MTEIVRRAVAGTLESSDAYVEIEPGQSGIEIDIDSVVINQFGDDLHRCITEVLDEQGVKNVKLRLVDRGALDCVVRARVETAVMRGKEV